MILEDPTVRCSLPTNQLIQSWSILPLVLTLVEKICIRCILTFAFSRKVINVKWTYKKFFVKIMCDRILFKITEELDSNVIQICNYSYYSCNIIHIRFNMIYSLAIINYIYSVCIWSKWLYLTVSDQTWTKSDFRFELRYWNSW